MILAARWAAMLPVTAEGGGRLEAVEPPSRSLVKARLGQAAAAGEAGSVDCRVCGPDGATLRFRSREESGKNYLSLRKLGSAGRRVRSSPGTARELLRLADL